MTKLLYSYVEMLLNQDRLLNDGSRPLALLEDTAMRRSVGIVPSRGLNLHGCVRDLTGTARLASSSDVGGRYIRSVLGSGHRRIVRSLVRFSFLELAYRKKRDVFQPQNSKCVCVPPWTCVFWSSLLWTNVDV